MLILIKVANNLNSYVLQFHATTMICYACNVSDLKEIEAATFPIFLIFVNRSAIGKKIFVRSLSFLGPPRQEL